ncbi:MAG: tetratricopeptide repeat protein [Myxococcales bacterium]|nr:tetratricopeptide repeat protein [Myxococcales bacterium]
MTAAPVSTRWPPTNLASERTTFVGRERDLEALEALVTSGERLITLLGPGGAGKTRLARQIGARLLKDPRGPVRSVWFCDLAEARSEVELLAAVGSALHVPLVSARSDTSDPIAHALAARQPLLLILDNFEQLVEHAARTVGAWHAKAAGVVFLLTSRVRLRLEGETQVDVGPLSEADALALFEERARKVVPSFRVSQDEASSRELVRRLDLSPLAIELAAARVKVLPPGKLLGRLAARLDLLKSGNRDVLPRHATLRSALDGSWELLEAWERRALAQCSVFHGGFTLEAAEAVLRAESDAEPEVVDVLEALVEKSLLVRDEERHDGDVRFRLSESVRDYAAEQLAELSPGAVIDAADRHAAFYLAEIEAHTTEALVPWAAVADRRAIQEIDNLMAIVRRAEGRDPASLVRAALCIDALLHARGPAEAQRSVLDRALSVANDPSVPAEARVRLFTVSADARRLHGQLGAARADAATAAAAAKAAGTSARSLVDVVLAEIELDAGRLAEARLAAESALALARASADPRTEVVALHTLVRAHVDADALEEARLRSDEALPLARSLGLPLIESRIEKLLGVVAARGAHLTKAEQHYAAAYALARELGDTHLEATSLHNLADVQARRGDLDGALARFGQVLELAAGTGFRRGEGVAKNHIGLIEHERGNLDAARAAHAAGNAIHREMGNVRSEAFGLEESGLLALEERRYDDAIVMLERSIDLARATGLGAVSAGSAACLAAVHAERGSLAEARTQLDLAAAAARAVGRPEPTGFVALHEGIVLAAEARAARASGDLERASERLAAARRALDEGAAVASHSARCRVTRRLLDRAIAGAAEAPAGTGSEGARALVVGEDGRWFRLPGAEPVDLSTRKSLRLMLARLAQSRLESPGEALDLERLFEAGWPGERIAPTAAFRRVYTAIGTLRDLGLRDVLIRRDDGYLLSPALPLLKKFGTP